MTWTIEWSVAAEEGLKRLPSWQVAARVASAVLELARTGRGDLRRVRGQDYRLYVGMYVVRLSMDQQSHTIDVWTIFRSG